VEEGGATAPIKTRDGKEIPDRVDLKLSKEALAAAREGMIRVVNNYPAGTGTDGKMDEMIVAGKTGTAQASELRPPLRDDQGNIVRDHDGKIVRKTIVPATIDHPTDTPWYRGWNEDGKALNHAWFIGFAPANDPQVAFAVMVQYGGSGGHVAAETAKKALMACVEHGYIKLPK
jgi:cell division protein FtsI/penicillin-binding protein 2